MSKYDDWLKVAIEIAKSLPEANTIKCPSCHQKAIDYQYIGNLQTRMGYMLIWCNVCFEGINMSRVRAPESAPILDIDSKLELDNRIPRFIKLN